MFRLLALLIVAGSAACVAARPGYAQNNLPPLTDANSFPFVLPWDDNKMGTATDVSFLNTKPAGKNGRIMARNGHFFEEKTGKRIRFFGVNITARGAFPSKADADKIAARLAKLGVNIVRFHHINNGWDTDGGTIWKKGRTFIEIDPAQREKLDYFISALKQNGIYTNINLQTAREYIPELGLPESVRQIPDFQKKVDKVNEKMIQLQQEYARQLLDRKNPYTNLKYADDPALLVLEINNENSLVGAPWEGPGTAPARWPEPFRGEVVKLWNAWIKKTYQTDENLAKAWPTVSKLEGKSLITAKSVWTTENQSKGDVAFQEFPIEEKAEHSKGLQATVRSNPGPNWHVQAHLGGLTLQESKVYTLEFRAKADKKTSIGVDCRMNEPDWSHVGLNTTAALEPEWKTFTYAFRAVGAGPAGFHSSGKSPSLRISFVLGDVRGTVTIQDVSLALGERTVGIRPGESLEKGNFPLPTPDASPRWRDYVRFLTDTERAYSERMRKFLREDLGFKHTNIIDTQIAWGGLTALTRERNMEFADNHEYWNHPDFPGGGWDPKNYRVNRRALVNELNKSGGTLASLARNRVFGKPYSVSEYNHPAPSDYQCEMMPLYATFAAFQDWDMIYVFDWGATGTGVKNEMYEGYFDSSRNPAKSAFFPAAALIFRTQAFPTSEREAQLRFGPRTGEQFPTASSVWNAMKYEETDFLRQRFSLRLAEGEGMSMQKTGGGSVQPFFLIEGNGGNILFTNTPQVQAVAGFVGGATVSTKSATFAFDKFGVNFAALTLTAKDGKPLAESGSSLLTLVARVENQNMGWNKERTSVSNQWGEGPVRAEFVPCRVELKTDGEREVYALDPTGARKQKLAVKYQNGTLSFTIGPETKSLWFEIAKQ